ncbi:aldehyde dehydrogenase family protein [Pseudomonadota bacterium]
MSSFQVINPFTNEVDRCYSMHSIDQAQKLIEQAHQTQRQWAKRALAQRIKAVRDGLEYFETNRTLIAKDICLQMGRPIQQADNEINGFFERANYLCDTAESALKPIHLPEKPNFERRIEHAPLGVVFVIAAWNYPLLTAVNSIIPALLAGNSVILKHSSQTPEIGLHFERAFGQLGDHKQLLQSLFLDHATTGQIIESCPINQVIFTGSVQGGQQILQHTAKKFIQPVLELGGKDGVYISDKANLKLAAEGLVDGAIYNSGQSCCGIERAYVHEDIYERLLSLLIPLMENYRLGNPLNKDTTLGPLAQAKQATLLEEQLQQATAQGGKVLTGGKARQIEDGTFWEPTLVVDVDHEMSLMKQENFGPILPIMKVKEFDEATTLINDSDYGLTAAIYTEDSDEAEQFAAEVNVGTVFRNRCDYLDPALPWSGVKQSGCGCSLSQFGFLSVTRRKAIHFRTKTTGS